MYVISYSSYYELIMETYSLETLNCLQDLFWLVNCFICLCKHISGYLMIVTLTNQA